MILSVGTVVVVCVWCAAIMFGIDRDILIVSDVMCMCCSVVLSDVSKVGTVV